MQELYGFIVQSSGYRDKKKVNLVDMPANYSVFLCYTKGLQREGMDVQAMNHLAFMTVQRLDDLVIGDALIIRKKEFERITLERESGEVPVLQDYKNLGSCLSINSQISIDVSDFATNLRQSKTWLPNSIAFMYRFCQTKIRGFVDMKNTNSYLFESSGEKIFKVTSVKRARNKIIAEPEDPTLLVRPNDFYLGSAELLDVTDGELRYGFAKQKVGTAFLQETFPALGHYDIDGKQGVHRVLISFERVKTDYGYHISDDYFLLEGTQITTLAENVRFENRRIFLGNYIREFKKLFGNRYPAVLIQCNTGPDYRSFESTEHKPIPLALSRGSS